jgi:hypothetical protein
MKTIHYFLSAAFLFVSSLVMAQTANVVIFSQDADRFYVLVNGVHQNKEAQSNVKLTQMPVSAYKVKVIFQDNSMKPLEKTVYPEAGQEYTMNIKRSKKGELKMTLFSVVDIPNSNQPGQYVVVYGTVDNGQPLQNGTTVVTTQPVVTEVAPSNTNTNTNTNVVNTNTNVTTTSTTTTNSANTNVVVSDPNMPNNANVNVSTNVVENPNGANVNTTIGDGQNSLNLNISVSETGVNMNINEMHSDPNLQNNNANVNVNTNIANPSTTTNNTYTETTTVTTTTKVNGQVVDHNSTTTQVNGQNGNVNNNVTTTTAMPATSGPCYAMSSADFTKLKTSIDAKTFEDTRLTVAKQAIAANCLTAEQVKEIMGMFDHESTRLEFAKLAYKRCSDPQNYFQVNDAFDFDMTVDELEAFIKKN